MSESQPPPKGPEPTTPDAASSTSSSTGSTRATPPAPGATGSKTSKTSSSSKSGGSAQQDPLRGSRTSGLWASLVASVVILVLLIIFIAQNTAPVSITFLAWEGSTPLAVAILAATVAGLFLAAVAGSLRILQLRRRVKRDGKR